jgi:glycosyltransferase involved in cell wall biosynthesis
MKIAYVYPEKLPTKKARAISVINTVNAIANFHEITLIAQDIKKEEIEKFYNIKVNFNIISLKRKFIINSNKIFNFNLNKVLNNFDVFYVRHLKTAKYLLDKQKNIIYESHEIFSINNDKLKTIENYVFNQAKGVIFINEFLKLQCNKSFNIKGKQKVIRNGCGFNIDFIKKDFSNITAINYIGSFYPWKGVDFLIESLNNRDINVEIIGDGDRKEEIKNKSNSNIHFLGYKKPSEIEHILINSQLTVIPNIPSVDTDFSTPIKLYEYLMTSNIVLSYSSPTIQEIIKDGENGFLFDAGDKNSFLEKLEYILSLKKEELERISQNAYETGKQFTWDNRAKDILEFINDNFPKT